MADAEHHSEYEYNNMDTVLQKKTCDTAILFMGQLVLENAIHQPYHALDKRWALITLAASLAAKKTRTWQGHASTETDMKVEALRGILHLPLKGPQCKAVFYLQARPSASGTQFKASWVFCLQTMIYRHHCKIDSVCQSQAGGSINFKQ